MSRLPSLSVLIACYNGMPWVVDCIKSLLPQLDDGIECILVDDGSTDGSGDSVRALADGRVRVIRQDNAGFANARNQALTFATGELVVWFDADDLFPPNTLEYRRRVFAGDDRLEMHYGQYEVFYMQSERKEVYPQPPCDSTYVADCLLMRRNLPHINSLTIRRRSLDRVGPFDEALDISADWGFFLRAFGRLHWQFDPVILAYQRQENPMSLTKRRGKVTTYREQAPMLTRNRAMARELLGSDRPWREAFSSYAADFSLVLLSHGMRREAAVWGLKSLWFSRRHGVRGLKYAAEAIAPTVYTRAVRFLKHARRPADANAAR